MTYYRRRTLEPWEEAAALAAGAAVGMGVSYLVRIWLRRSPTTSEPRPRDPTEEGERRAAGAPLPSEGETGRPQ